MTFFFILDLENNSVSLKPLALNFRDHTVYSFDQLWNDLRTHRLKSFECFCGQLIVIFVVDQINESSDSTFLNCYCLVWTIALNYISEAETGGFFGVINSRF